MTDKFASMVEYDKKYEAQKRWFVPTELPCCVIDVVGSREGALNTKDNTWPEHRYVSLHQLEDYEHVPDTWRARVKGAWRALRHGVQARYWQEFNRVEEIEALIAALTEAKAFAFDLPIEEWKAGA